MATSPLSHSQLEELWVIAGGSEATADTAAAIAQAESGGCQYAQRGPRDIRPVKACVYVHDPVRYVIGLWQINQSAHPSYSRTGLFSPTYNADAAVAISNGGASFEPWTTYTSGAYRAFLQSGGTPTAQPGPVTVTAGSSVAPSSLKGWADLRNSVARHLPTQLQHSRRLGVATLRGLPHRHRLGG